MSEKIKNALKELPPNVTYSPMEKGTATRYTSEKHMQVRGLRARPPPYSKDGNSYICKPALLYSYSHRRMSLS